MKEDEKKSGERDEELVRRAQSGDKQATEALLVRFAGADQRYFPGGFNLSNT